MQSVWNGMDRSTVRSKEMEVRFRWVLPLSSFVFPLLFLFSFLVFFFLFLFCVKVWVNLAFYSCFLFLFIYLFIYWGPDFIFFIVLQHWFHDFYKTFTVFWVNRLKRVFRPSFRLAPFETHLKWSELKCFGQDHNPWFKLSKPWLWSLFFFFSVSPFSLKVAS